MPGTAENLAFLVGKLPDGATWSVSGIGRAHMPMMLAEECGELIQAVSKDQREFSLETQDAVLNEMADVLISIGALMAQMELEPTDLFDRIDAKLMKQY
jgi:NTP pyrophosphatase (non-canonical NTP hydrolase)